jgi:hypothetical protein
VSSWIPFKYNADGSLDLYFHNESPGTNEQADWLPAPKGAFTLTVRHYAPKQEALTGKWNPPPVTKVLEPSAFQRNDLKASWFDWSRRLRVIERYTSIGKSYEASVLSH